MDIPIFIYYMIYTLVYKVGQFAFHFSPLSFNKNDRRALERKEIITSNSSSALFVFGLLLYSFVIYLYMPHIGLGTLQKVLLVQMGYDMITLGILSILAIPMYFLYFYNNKYLKYFDKFRKMNFYLKLSYSIISLFLIILPIILIFAAI